MDKDHNIIKQKNENDTCDNRDISDLMIVCYITTHDAITIWAW